MYRELSRLIPPHLKEDGESSVAFVEKGISEYGIRSSFENFSEYDRIKVIPIYTLGSYLKNL